MSIQTKPNKKADEGEREDTSADPASVSGPTSSNYEPYKSLSTSCHTSVSNESDLSFNLSLDAELCEMDVDELPAFDIRLLSPLGRSPSPIDNNTDPAEYVTPHKSNNDDDFIASHSQNHPDFVALQDINAKISPPAENSEANSLETIYEGVFLQTPPRTSYNNTQNRHTRGRKNLQEIAVMMCQQIGKENQSPHVTQRSNAIRPEPESEQTPKNKQS